MNSYWVAHASAQTRGQNQWDIQSWLRFVRRCCFLTFVQHLEASFSFFSRLVPHHINSAQLNSSLSVNLTLQISQGSASTYIRWSRQFRHSFVKALFRDIPSNFYWNRFIFDEQGAKDKLAHFLDTVYIYMPHVYANDWRQQWMVSVAVCCVQVVNEVKDSSDARELLLASITQADTLTHVVNKRITAEHVQQQPSEDTATGNCLVELFKHSLLWTWHNKIF